MKKIFAIALLFSVFAKPTLAQEITEAQEWDYVEIVQGTPAPMNGLLFSYDGMSNALAKIQQKIRLLEIEKQDEKDKLKIDLEAKIKISDVKLNSLKEQYETQVKVKNETIDSLTKELYISKIKVYGGLALGITTGILVTFFIYGNK